MQWDKSWGDFPVSPVEDPIEIAIGFRITEWEIASLPETAHPLGLE